MGVCSPFAVGSDSVTVRSVMVMDSLSSQLSPGLNPKSRDGW